MKTTLEQIIKEYARRAPLTTYEKWRLYLLIPEMFGKMNANEKRENKRKR